MMNFNERLAIVHLYEQYHVLATMEWSEELNILFTPDGSAERFHISCERLQKAFMEWKEALDAL